MRTVEFYPEYGKLQERKWFRQKAKMWKTEIFLTEAGGEEMEKEEQAAAGQLNTEEKQRQAMRQKKEKSRSKYLDGKQRSRVDIQVSIMTALIVTISCCLIFVLNYYFYYQSMISDLKNRAFNIHDYLEERLDVSSFYLLEEREDNQTEIYQESKAVLENVKSAAGVRYLYTAKKTADGRLIYLVDGLPSENLDFRYIGDAIEPECRNDMERALKGEQVLPRKIKKTSWGSIFISYFPMHEGEKVVGVLGIEFDAKTQYETFRNMAVLTPAVIILFCMIASVTAVILFRRISNPSYRDLASTDFLTGLRNRNAFEVSVNNLNSKPEKSSVALISFDLNRLKTVNDTYGHAAGDEYIRNSTKLMRKYIREPDILYRIGGDEFCAVLRNKTRDSIEQILSGIKEEVQRADEQSTYPMGISMGYAFYQPQEDASLYETLKKADQKMYEDKKAGREKEI